MTRQALAKLTRPRLFGVVARERLFGVLDAVGDHPATWVSGPPGAGKTMLVASYLESRGMPTSWYQFDSADADPANLFYYLRESLPARQSVLPLLTAEYQADLAAFARRFFRAFFAKLPRDSVLVIDGLPPLDTVAGLKTVVLEAIQEVPDRRRLIVVSREDIPLDFSRLHLQGSVAAIGWSDLKLTIEETRGVASGVMNLPAPALQTLHEQAQGWMAGLRLLLEHYRTTGQLSPSVMPGRQDALFGFFAAEIFDRLTEEIRNVLLRTCLLPRVSAGTAERMTGDQHAWRALAELNQRHLFVDRLQGETPVFQYHALFRTFLCERAQHLLGSPEWTRLQRQAASLLVEAGQTENAIPLLAQAGDWAAAARLILVESGQMLARGHSQTLANWVRALPSWYVAATPRLLYCLGMAQIASDPEAARATLERSYERFAAESNPLGQALAAAAIVQTYYLRFDHLLGLPRWVDELTRLLAGDLVFPSAETELHVRSMLQMAMTYVRPDHPELPRCAERVESLISRGLETNLTISAAALLLTYYDWFAPEKARLLLGYVTPRTDSPDVVPFNRIWWLLAAGYHHRFQGETAHMRNAFALAEEIARQSGLRSTLVLLLLVRVYECMALGDGTAGAAELAKAAEVLTPGRRQEEYVFHLFAAQIALLQRDGHHAREHAQKAHRVACEIGHRFSEMESLGILALALCESGEGEAALRAVRQAASLPGAAASDKIAFHHLLIEAYASLRVGQTADARNLLVRAYALGRSNGYVFGFVWLPSMIATLCAEALRAGIETEYVLGVIRTCGLLPPGPDVRGNWPWPVKVRVLDRVEIEVEGKPIARSRKAQKKPLELLGALVAKGPAGADRALLAQELWPDSEGDAAESALRMNLHRLRKLLRHDESIAMQEGKIRLNDRVVWVDGWAFETACAELEGAGERPANAEGVGRQALELYRGPAFGREAPLPWMLPARERWRGKFVTAVALIGALEERREDWAGAAAVYQRALNADPLSEEMYRRLMECFLRQKKHAEAYAVYRRCRDMLSITLGVRPSAETEALRKTIASQDAQGETAG